MRRTSLTRCATPLGEMLLAGEGSALVGAWFVGQRYYPAHLEPDTAGENTPPLCAARAWLKAYFAGTQGQELPPQPPLAPVGTPFQQAVWQLLRRIPYGDTTTYGSLAQQLRQNGIRASAQAVGGAVGRNPLSLFIPCHRVLATSGALAGYAGGLSRKAALLALETPGLFT